MSSQDEGSQSLIVRNLKDPCLLLDNVGPERLVRKAFFDDFEYDLILASAISILIFRHIDSAQGQDPTSSDLYPGRQEPIYPKRRGLLSKTPSARLALPAPNPFPDAM